MTNLSVGTPRSATDVVVSRAAGTGPATWSMGMLFERLVGAEETAGLLGASVVTQPPGQASPLHVHTREAEAWFLLQGAMTYRAGEDRKSTRLNSSHVEISYAVFCLKKK